MGIQLANFVRGTLASSITTSSTTLTLSAAVFPALTGSNYCMAVLQSATNRNTCEIIKVTAVNGTTLTVARAQEGTTAMAFNAGDLCELRMTAGALQPALDHKDIVASHVPSIAGTDYNKFLVADSSGVPLWKALTPSTIGAMASDGSITATGTFNLLGVNVNGTLYKYGAGDIIVNDQSGVAGRSLHIYDQVGVARFRADLNADSDAKGSFEFIGARTDITGLLYELGTRVYSANWSWGLGTTSQVGTSIVGRGSMNRIIANGFFEYNGDAGDTDGPAGYGNFLTLGQLGNASGYAGWAGQLFAATGGQLYWRVNTTKNTFAGSSWQQIYTTLYKPTPADIGAVAIAGGTMTGQLNTAGGLASSSGFSVSNGVVQIVNTGGANYNENLRLPRSTGGYSSISMACDTSGAGFVAGQFTWLVYPSAIQGGALALRTGATAAAAADALRVAQNGEFTFLPSTQQFRLIGGNYGVLFRNDGNRFWLLATASGDSAGSWSGIRPFSFDLSTGRTYISNAATVDNGLAVTGGLSVTGNSTIQGNIQVGNVPGASYVWGNSGIANQDYFVEVKGSGNTTGSTGYVFHNPNVSTAAIEYRNSTANAGTFQFKSDDDTWEIITNSFINVGTMATGKRGIYGCVGTNDFWYVGGGADAVNAGYLEISTGDDGTEPIYVRQYSGPPTSGGTVVRAATLLDGVGNTSFPGTIYSSYLEAANGMRAILSNFVGWSFNQNRYTDAPFYTNANIAFPNSDIFVPLVSTYCSTNNVGYAFRVKFGVRSTGNGGWEEKRAGILVQSAESDSHPSYCHEFSANGNFYTGVVRAANRIVVRGYDTGNDGSVSCDNWFRSGGDSGWYSVDYGGGIHMVDNTWVRIFGGKKFHVPNNSGDAIYLAGGIKLEGSVTTGSEGGNSGMYIGGGQSPSANNSAANCTIFATPNLHLNAKGTYAVYLNYHAGTGGTRFCNGNGGEVASVDSTGLIYANGNVSANNLIWRSDARLKSNFEAITSPVAKIKQLIGQTYDKLRVLGAKETIRETGLIAQDVQKVLPHSVHEDSNTGLLSIDTSGLIALLVETCKELAGRVEALEGGNYGG